MAPTHTRGTCLTAKDSATPTRRVPIRCRERPTTRTCSRAVVKGRVSQLLSCQAVGETATVTLLLFAVVRSEKA